MNIVKKTRVLNCKLVETSTRNLYQFSTKLYPELSRFYIMYEIRRHSQGSTIPQEYSDEAINQMLSGNKGKCIQLTVMFYHTNSHGNEGQQLINQLWWILLNKKMY